MNVQEISIMQQNYLKDTQELDLPRLQEEIKTKHLEKFLDLLESQAVGIPSALKSELFRNISNMYFSIDNFVEAFKYADLSLKNVANGVPITKENLQEEPMIFISRSLLCKYRALSHLEHDAHKLDALINDLNVVLDVCQTRKNEEGESERLQKVLTICKQTLNKAHQLKVKIDDISEEVNNSCHATTSVIGDGTDFNDDGLAKIDLNCV